MLTNVSFPSGSDKVQLMPCHLLIQISHRPPGDRLGNWPAELEPVSICSTKTSCCWGGFFHLTVQNFSQNLLMNIWIHSSGKTVACRRILGLLSGFSFIFKCIICSWQNCIISIFFHCIWILIIKKKSTANLKVLSVTVQHCCSIYFYFLSQFKDQESFGEELRGFSVRNGARNHNETIIDWLHILGGFVIFKKLSAFRPFVVICRVFRSSSLNPNQP